MIEYIEASEISNSTNIDIIDVDGFLKIASANSIRIVFIILPKENRLGTDNIFFFPSNGFIYRLHGKNYKTLEDFQQAKTQGFTSSMEYYDALNLGFNTYEEYNHCKSLGIDKKDEFEEAKRCGFVNGFDIFMNERQRYNNFLHLKELPEKFHNPVELFKYAKSKHFNIFKDFESAISKGFPEFSIWKEADSKGFKYADDFYAALERGYFDSKDYFEALKLLIDSKKEFDQYKYFKLYSEGLNHDEFQIIKYLRSLNNDTGHSMTELRSYLENKQTEIKQTVTNNTHNSLPLWYKSGIDTEEKMKKFLLENKSARRVGFLDPEKDIFEIFKISKNKIYIDASNVAYSSSSSDKKTAEFKNIKLVILALINFGFKDITVIADASLKHKAKDIHHLNDLRKGISYHEVPANTSADDFLLQSAKREKCLIISNDNFSDWKIKDRWIANNIDDIRQPFMITNGKVMFAGLDKLLKTIKD